MPLRALAIIAILFTILFVLDLYVFQGVKTLTASWQSQMLRSVMHWGYWVVSLGLPGLMLFALFTLDRSHGFPPLVTMTSSLFVTLLVTKVVFVGVLMGGDVLRFAEGAIKWIQGPAEETAFMPERRRLVSQLALGIAAIPFASFLYGITKGKYNYKVHRHTVFFKDLPDAFEGFTITQISDVHSGSFNDPEAVRRGVEMASEQGSDLFVFTGDLVNNVAREFEPYEEMFRSITAPFGKYSILGNHDYGDYAQWDSVEEKHANLDHLMNLHAGAGFRLLLNESVEIEKDGEKMVLLGVENWGKGFAQYGDLGKALKEVDPTAFKVLLSHDPTHWDEQVKGHDTPIHLTLAGHTHGMQMGLEIPGFRWSPSQYRYKKWAGIYEEAGRILHINRGFGFLGFSGRVGIWPEITVLELRKA